MDNHGQLKCFLEYFGCLAYPRCQAWGFANPCKERCGRLFHDICVVYLLAKILYLFPSYQRHLKTPAYTGRYDSRYSGFHVYCVLLHLDYVIDLHNPLSRCESGEVRRLSSFVKGSFRRHDRLLRLWKHGRQRVVIFYPIDSFCVLWKHFAPELSYRHSEYNLWEHETDRYIQVQSEPL